jgi:hypothetical protein
VRLPLHAAVDPGVALLWEANVDLVVVGRGQVVIAPYARNVDRLVRALRDAGAELQVAHGTETLAVDVTPQWIRSERRSAWAAGPVRVDVDLEPVPGLDFGALLLDAPLQQPGDPGPPWACAEHQQVIAAARRGP